MARLLPVIILNLCVVIFVLSSAVPDIHAIENRDFSADLRNFNQITQLLYNIRSMIGIPFSAMTNVGLSLHEVLEISPLDLALLPSGYCYSCDTVAHPTPDNSRPPSPFQNRMVEIDEEQIIIVCSEVDAEHGPELPFMKACPGQQEVLKEFLADLRARGSRLAVPKERLENAPFLEWKYAAGEGGYRCVSKDRTGNRCREAAELPGVTSPATISMSGGFVEFQKSLYQGIGAQQTSLSSSPSPTASVSSLLKVNPAASTLLALPSSELVSPFNGP